MTRTRKQWMYLLAFVMALAFTFIACKATYAKTEDSAGTSETTEYTLKTPDEVSADRIVWDRPVVTCADRTASKVYLQWKKVGRATRYHIYRSTEKTGEYTHVGSTSELTFTDKKLASGQTYYYKVYAAGTGKKGQRILSKFSKSLKVTTKSKVKKTAYVGDSVMSGFSVYQIIKGSGKKVIYKIGVSPSNFYNGTPMDQLLAYKPDRMYIMLGTNCLVGSPSSSQMDTQVRYYKKIIQECLKENPDMQVIVLPVSPTRPSATVHNSSINKFNAKLESMTEDLNVYYYDYTECLRGSDGTLKSSCSAGDGIHLTPSAYRTFLEYLNSCGNALD